MNAPVLLAQLLGSSAQTPAPPKNIKLEKPQSGAAVTVHLDGQTQLDFSDVASEKLTFVRVGDKLIVLFDNQSTVTVDPVFGSDGHPLANILFEMAPDRTLSGDQFASLFPITTDQSVLPAAGPGGNGPTSGAHFGDPTVDPLSTGTPLDLLGAENNQSTLNAFVQPAGNPTPIPGVIATATVNEDALPGGNPGAPGVVTVTGSLNVNFGTDTVGRSFSFAASQAGLSGLTSDGQTVHLFVTTIGGLPTMIGYVGTDPSIVANEVFTVSLNANATLDGTYTFTLLRPLDHPILGVEDTLDLSISVIATDGSGDTAPTVIHVDVVDNVPIIIAANETHSTITDPVTGAVATSTGSLGISWGADNFNDHVDGGVSATTGKDGDRAVVFSDTVVTATGDAAGVVSSIASLTSNGAAVHYVLLNNGTELVAYTGSTTPTTFPTDAATAASEHVVFTVSLSDAGNSGNYVISQYQSLDHNSGTALFDSIDLSFHYTATDSDGDPVSATLTTTIDDTVPTVTESLVTHSTITDPVIAVDATAAGTLGITWGADSANATIDGGITTADGDRAVIFTNATVTATGSASDGDGGSVVNGITGLTSENQAVHYVLLDNGTVLVAYTGNIAPTTVPTSGGSSEGHNGDSPGVPSNVVFVVTLTDDSATGGYTVTQYQPLDHIADGTKFDSINLTFNFTAVDSDGDPATGTLTVTVDDTSPVITGTIFDQTLNEQALPDGNHVNGDTVTATASLGIDWGADNEIVTSVGGFGRTLAFLAGDDSTAIAGGSAPVSSLALSIAGEQGSALSSGGVALVYTVTANSNGGETLTAYQGSTSGSVIFTLSLDPTANSGSYTFTLDGPLDNAAGSNSISLTFTVQATDADGDAVQQHFTVDVQDDVPVVTGIVADQTVGEEGLATGNHGTAGEAQNASTGVVSLNIAWGADDNNSGLTNNRTVAFASNTISTLQGMHLTSDGQSLSYAITTDSNGEQLLTATAGTGKSATAVFTVQLSDLNNGSYDFTLLGNLDHPVGQGANEIAFTFNVVGTDSDGDTVNQSFAVNVQDDVPVAGIGTAESVKEANLSDGSSPDRHDLSVTGSLNVAWGADGNDSGSTNNRSVSFQHGTASADVQVTDNNGNTITGLTSNGATVQYLIFNGELIAYTNNDPLFHQVFTVSLNDNGTGSYTFTLLSNLDHPAGNGNNTLNLTFDYTATDSDGDPSSNTFTVTVVDDVPTAHVGDSTVINEANLPNGNQPLFFWFPQVSGDLNIVWGADNNNSGPSNNRSVAFQNNNAALDVQVTDSNGNPVAGLTSDGATVNYAFLNGVLVGYTANNPHFNQVFTVSLNDNGDGSYTFTLLGNLDHPTGQGTNLLNFTFDYTATDSDGDTSSNVFTVSVKDSVPLAFNVGLQTVGEEGLADGNHIFGDAHNASTGNVSLNIAWGADDNNPTSGVGTNDRSVVFASNTVSALNALNLTSNGQALSYVITQDATGALLTATAGTGAGLHNVFTVQLSDSSNGSYNFTLLDNLDHQTGNGTNFDNLTFNVVATDSDGDPASQSFTVGIQDDVPVVTNNVQTHTVGEEGLADGNKNVHDEAQNASTGNVSLNISWGADQNNPTTGGGAHDRSVTFASNTISSLNALHLTSNGQSLSYAITQDATGSLLTATAGSDSHSVFAVQLSDANNGTYNFTLLDNIDHPSVQGGNFDNLTFNVVATDSDGDAVGQSFTVGVQDDVPILVGSVTNGTVSEDGLPTGNDVTGANHTVVLTNESLNVSWGADNDIQTSLSDPVGRTLTFNTTGRSSITPVDSQGNALNLSSNGTALQYVLTNLANGGQELDAYRGSTHNASTLIFTVTLDPTSANGDYNFTLSGNLDDLSSNGTPLSDLKLNFGVTATDSDGDTVQTNFTVDVLDDAPVVAAVTAQTVGEEGLTGANHNVVGEAQNASTGNVSLNISWGADNNNPTSGSGTHDRSVTFASNTVSALNTLHLTSNGQSLTYVISEDSTGALLTATAGSGNDKHTVFTVQLSDTANGTYNFTLLDNLDHPAGQGANLENLIFNVVATDSDGDTAAQSFAVNVQDDVPVASGTPVAAESVFEAGLPGGNTPADATSVGSVTPEALNINWGADNEIATSVGGFGRTLSFLAGDNSTAIAGGTSLVSSLAMNITGEQGTALSSGGVALVYTVTANANGGETLTAFKGTNGPEIFTLTLDPTQAHGGYTFNLLGPLDDASNSNAIGLTFTVQAADADGDTVNTQFTVNVQDDVPVVTGVTAQTVGEEGLSFGNHNLPNEAQNASTGNVSLNIAWGADANNSGATDNRSVTFASGTVSALQGLNLTSNGQALSYIITTDSNGEQLLMASAGGHTVFTVQLSDNNNGTYNFTLLDNLDHPAGQGANLENLTFNVVATDSDGDTAAQSFTVNVQDDLPVIGTPAVTTVLEDTLVSHGPATSHGSLGVSFGADGPAATVLATSPTVTLNFDALPNGGGAPYHIGDFTIATNQGVANTTGLHGEVYGTVITVTDSAGPFTLSSVNLGLYGTSTGVTADNVTLIGIDTHGNTITDTVNLGATLALGTPLTYLFNAAGTPFAGVALTSLEIEPVLTRNPDGSIFNGSVVIDNLAVTQDSSAPPPVVSAPVMFANQASAAANISIVDNSGVSHDAATLTSHGQTIHYELLDAVTLVGYTGTAPSSINASNVVFSVVLSENSGNPNGAYDFTLLQPLDDLPASVTDLKLSFNFTATDGDGDTTPGQFTVDVHDDVPTLVAPTPVAIVDGNFAGGPGDYPEAASFGAIDTKGSIEGWTYTASPVGGATQVELEHVYSGYSGAFSTDGSAMVDLEASPGNIQVSQNVTGLTAGEHLLVSFEIGEANFGNAKLEVLWDGQEVGTYNPQNGQMQIETIAVTAQGNNADLLTFEEIGVAGDNTGTYLTDVSATQVAGTVYEAGLNDTVSINTTVSIPGGGSFTETLSHQITGTEAGAANAPTTASGTLAGLVNFGADGPAMNGAAANGFELVPQNDGAVTTFLQGLGLSSLGSAVDHGTLVGDTMTAIAADGHNVFTLTVNGDGTWTFNLLAPLKDAHLGADSINLDFSSLVKAVDFDGDSVALASHTFSVAVVDDVPVDTGTPAVGTVSETGLPFVSFTDNPLMISYGADGESGHLSFAVDSQGNPIVPAGLTSGGVALSYTLETVSGGEQQLVAYRSDESAATPVFEVTLNSPENPTYIFSLFQPLDHDGTLPLTFTVSATDGDGDTVQQSFTVNVQDSVPTIGTSAVGDVSEDGPLTLTNAPLAVNFGADNGTFSGSHLGLAFTDSVVTATDPNGTVVPLTSYGHAISIEFIGGELIGYTGTAPTSATDSNVVFMATLSAATGTYDFTLNHPLDNAAPASGNDSLNLTFDITATDSDGSQATGHFTVNVDAAGSTSTAGLLDYSNETTGVFVNLTDSAFATAGQTVQGHTATDATSGGGHVIGIDALGSITDVTGGSGDDILLGGNTANTMHGGDGNDLLIGFGGNDQLFGDAGNDTFVYSVGDGRDVVDGGTGIDTQIVDGVTTAETFNINAIDPTHLGINIVAGFDNAVLATTANAAISDTNVEEILINLSTAGDTVIISGDLSGTGVATNTITINGNSGNDLVDLSTFTSNEDVVFDGAGNGATGDTVIYGFAFNAATYAPVLDSGGHLIGAEITYTSADGPVTDTITNVEHFQFADQTLSVGQIFAPTAPAENVAVADTVAVDAGNMLANGNALIGVIDVDVHTTLSVTAVNGSAGGVGHDVTGSYGTLEMNSDGTYSYTANPALDALPAGTTATDTFQFTVTDSNGGATTTSLNFNITGAADTPVVNAVVATAADTAAHDAGTIVAHGNLITDAGDSDRDAGVTLTVTAVGSFAMTPGGVDIANTYGTLHVNSDGSYTFTANAAFDALTPGQTPSLLQAFTVSSSDGASQTSNISLTITGAADTPVVNAVVATAADTAAHDAGTIVAHGNLITDAGDSDRDAGVTLTVTAVGSFAMTPGGVDIANTYGTLHVNSDGSYTFTANAAFDALTPGQTPSLLQAFTVSSSDGASQTSNISLTITGAADTPVVNAVVATAADTAAHDAGTIVAHGNLITDAGDSDRDAGVTLTVTAVGSFAMTPGGVDIANTYGTLHVNSDGSYTFTANAAFDALTPGQTPSLLQAFTVSSSDGASQTSNISLTFTGAADTPVITSATTASEAEGTPASNVVYQIAATEADTGAHLTYQLGGTDAHDFTVSSTGAVTFVSSPNFETQHTFNIAVEVFNGTTEAIQAVTINVTPVDNGIAPLTISDTTQTVTAPKVGDVLHATLGTDPDGGNGTGTPTYTWFDNGQQINGATGQNYTVTTNDVGHTITVSASYVDGEGFSDTTTSAATQTVITANHPPVIDTVHTTATGSVTEGASYGAAAVGQLILDGGFEGYAQNGELQWMLPPPSWTTTGSVFQDYSNAHTGAFAVDFNGNTDSINSLSQTVTTVVGQTYTLTFFLRDPAGQDGALSGSLTPAEFDVHATGGATTAINYATDGSYHEYSYQFTATSTQTTVTFSTPEFPYGFLDLDDVALVNGVTPGATAGIETASGTIKFTDADITDTHTATAGNPTFAWSGGLLNQNEITTLTNDSVLTLTEVDNAGTGTGSVAWNYQVSDSALTFLAPSQTLTETYVVTVSDGHGGTATENVSVTILGDIAPVNSVPAAQTDNSNSLLVFNTAHNNVISVSDTDSAILTETLSVSQGLLSLSTEAGLTFTQGDGVADATMTFSGTQANINAALSGLQYSPTSNYTGADTLQITTSDGVYTDTDTVGITVQTPNHAPVISGGTFVGSVTEGASYNTVSSGNLILNGNFDYYNGTFYTLQAWNTTGNVSLVGGYNSGGSAFLSAPSTLSQTIATVVGETYSIDFFASDYGTNTVSENGVVVGTLSGNDSYFTEYTYQFVATSSSTTISFAATTSYFLNIDQISVQSAPGTPGIETTTGTITFTDADHTDTHTIALGSPTFVWSGGALTGPELAALSAANASTLTLVETDSTGSGSGSVAWSYQIQDSAIQFLQANQTLTETYSVTINDGHGGITSQNVTVTVHGDAAPVNSVPAAQTVAANASLIFNTAHSDAISVSDADNTYLTETLTVSAGTLTLNGTTGLTFTAGDGTTDATMTFSGTQADINAALSGMTYNAGTGTFADTLTITSSDGTHATTSTVGITVTAPPVSSLAAASLDLSSDSGVSTSDNVTNVTKPVMTITGLKNTAMFVGEKIEIIDTSNGNAVVGSYTVQGSDLNGSGLWASNSGKNITLATDLANGSHNLEAVLADTSGHTGTASPNLTVTEDTTKPTVTVTQTNTGGSTGTGTVTFSFSEQVFNFTNADISTSRVTLSGNLTDHGISGGRDIWTESFSYSSGTNSITVNSGGYTDLAGNTGGSGGTGNFPAGVSGQAINLALTDYSDHGGMVSLTVAGLAAGWALSEGTHNADGSWTVQTNDIGALSVTSPDGYVGALVLNVSESWTNADGTHGTATVADNVEAYAKGSPIFAWSGDDTLTASIGSDTLVFANQIGNDVVHNFDTMHDKIDLIGFAGFASFADVQAHLGHDASGDAVITLGDGETITLNGVAAASLNAGDFEFDQTPVTYNTGDMVISDGALLPLSGIVDNTGSIHLSSAGNETDLEIVQHGATFQGGGTVVLSDNAENVIFGSDPSVTLTNVDNTISGAGHLGDGQMTLVNEGSIIADGINALDIDTGGNTIVNSGTLEATGAGGLTVHSDLANDGLLWANGGNVTLDGEVSGRGSALISGNASLEIGGAFSEQIQFDDHASGTLKIDSSVDFHGILSGFGSHDSIDLGDILASTASLNYAENANGTGGTLTVNDGSHTANIALSGQYAAADFHLSSDSTNHVLIQMEHQAHQVAAAA